MGWFDFLLPRRVNGEMAAGGTGSSVVMATSLPPAAGSPLAPPVASPASPYRLDVRDALTRLAWRDVEAWCVALSGPMTDAGITSPIRVAALLGNATVETSSGTRLVESLNYSTAALRSTFGPHRISDAECRAFGRAPGRPADETSIANRVYGGVWGLNLGNDQPGDGWRFRGRGLLQTTGRSNYARLSRDTGIALDRLPDMMSTREGAALAACLWWTAAKMNPVADTGDTVTIRRRVNGGTLGLDEFQKAFRLALPSST